MSNNQQLNKESYSFQDYLSLYSDILLSIVNLEFIYSNLKPDISELSLSVKSRIYSSIESLKQAELLLVESVPDIKAAISL